MMDQKFIDAIVKVVYNSDMSDLNLLKVETRVIQYDDSRNETHTSTIFVSDRFGGKAKLSEAWVAGNLLLFTVFNGHLENKYKLLEGESFKKHYDNLPELSDFDIMNKNCYRIFKIIRNAIQHSLSNVTWANGSCSINYTNKSTNYVLQISAKGIRCLYTFVMNSINGYIYDMEKMFCTAGHYLGLMQTIYSEFEKGIVKFSDEMGNSLLPVKRDFSLRAAVRYPVLNPIIINENAEKIIFKHIENNFTDDESDDNYNYSTDYVFEGYLLPQEIGTRIRYKSDNLQERLSKGTITFKKSDLDEKWKIK